MKLGPGAVLGPYEISGSIGAGGMGEVYRARDTRLGREVAIKVLPREVTGDPERLARFEREARASSALNHPNIVTVHDFAGDSEERYLVMELVRGESLRDLIGRGPLPHKRLLSIAAGLAEGLAAAHAAGIVHRDLKPENVMITADGVPKILDFGLVKSSSGMDAAADATEVKVTGTGVIVGTATYMSPEQARGDTVSFPSDQFTLGMILYEMAAGRHPFRRGTAYETVGAILNEEPEPLDEALPEPFRWIVERCLTKDPAGRYASTTDLARDLILVRDRGTPSTRTRPGEPVRRRPWALALSLLAIVAIAAMAAVLARRSAPGGIAAPLQLDLATPQIDVSFGEVATPVAISPDGRRVAAAGTAPNGSHDLWLYDLVTGEARLLAEDAFAPAWSSDGKQVAFFSGGMLKAVPAEGGPARTICEALPEGTPSWHGDKILFTQYSGGRERAGIYLADAGGGGLRRVVEAVPRIPMWPRFLPDGKRFLYVGLFVSHDRGPEFRRTLMLASIDGGEPRPVSPIESRAEYADGHILHVRDSTVFAQPFDPERGEVTGEARPLVAGVHYFRNIGGAAFTVSGNGVLAWRSSRQPSRLVWLDRGGVELETVGTAVHDLEGRLSADGTRYAVGIVDSAKGIGDIWTYDLVRSSQERVTFQTLDQRAPVWSRDGTSMFYRSDGGGGPPDIFKLTGGGRGEPFFKGPAVEQPEDVSPDGKWLLFTTFTHVTADIHVLPLDPKGEPRPFATTPFAEFSPRFSPDGRWVAYSSNLSGRHEIYVKAFESDGPAVRVSRDGGTRPRWSASGNELYFLGPAGRLMVIPFDGSFGTPRMLFQTSSLVTFEPSPDGQRFLAQLAEGRAEVPLHVLVNWRERLKR